MAPPKKEDEYAIISKQLEEITTKLNKLDKLETTINDQTKTIKSLLTDLNAVKNENKDLKQQVFSLHNKIDGESLFNEEVVPATALLNNSEAL